MQLTRLASGQDGSKAPLEVPCSLACLFQHLLPCCSDVSQAWGGLLWGSKTTNTPSAWAYNVCAEWGGKIHMVVLLGNTHSKLKHLTFESQAASVQDVMHLNWACQLAATYILGPHPDFVMAVDHVHRSIIRRKTHIRCVRMNACQQQPSATSPNIWGVAVGYTMMSCSLL